MIRRIYLSLFGGLAILTLILPTPLFAHGGSLPRVSDVESGPYRLFVWAEPVPAVTGEVKFTVAVAEIPAQKDGQAAPVFLGQDQGASRVGILIPSTAHHEEGGRARMIPLKIFLCITGIITVNLAEPHRGIVAGVSEYHRA